MERPTELRWYNDSGHGWLAVTVRDLLDSGVAPEISSCSYHDRQTATEANDCVSPSGTFKRHWFTVRGQPSDGRCIRCGVSYPLDRRFVR